MLQADDGKGFLKNTLRKLSAKKLEKLRAEALTNEQGEVYRGFPHTYWAFTKALMANTLTNMAEGDEASAMEVFSLILTYSGLVTPPKPEKEEGIYQAKEEEDHMLLIQTVLDKAMKKDCLVNEVFLQLMKQTTDHPEPNSRVNLRHWSVVEGVFVSAGGSVTHPAMPPQVPPLVTHTFTALLVMIFLNPCEEISSQSARL